MEWRITVAKKYIDLGYEKRFVLKICEIAKSTWYYRQRCPKNKEESKSKRGRPIPGHSYNLLGQAITDDQIVEILKYYRTQEFFTNAKGYRVLHYYLIREFRIVVNSKKLYRLCKENQLLLPRNKKKLKRSTYHCNSSNWVLTKSNQMWQFDIKYIYISGENRFAYYLGFIDVFDKEIVHYYLGLSCTGKNLKTTLAEAMKFRHISTDDILIVRSDRGTQMTSIKFGSFIDANENLIHELIPPHTPDKNAYIESFNSILEIEALQNISFKTYAEAYEGIERFVNHYNNRRLHGSIGHLPPTEFKERYATGDFGIIEVHVSG